MAESSNKKHVNDSEYEVGKKYRPIDIFDNIVAPVSSDGKGLRATELMDGRDMEQMLNIYLDDKGNWNYNLNSSFYIMGLPTSVISYFPVDDEMRWPTISYKIYGTTRLAWLLMKLNGVVGKDIFKPLQAGQTVAYLDRTKFIEPILASLRENEGTYDDGK